MYKLLVNGIKDFQHLIEVEKTGGYFDESKIVWDERIHGPMPEFTGQGQERYTLDGAPALRVNADLKTTQDAAKAAEDAALARQALKMTLCKRAELGADIVMDVAVLNVEKEMDEAARTAFATTFAAAKAALEGGLLSEAKTIIQGLTLPADYTEGDRSYVIGKIDAAISATS